MEKRLPASETPYGIGIDWLRIGKDFYKDEEAKKIMGIIHPTAEHPYWRIYFNNMTVIYTTEPVSYKTVE